MPNTAQLFITKNWQILVWIISAIFVAGGLFAEFQYLQTEIEVLNQRLGKKIEVINSLDSRVEKLEHHIEYEKGYKAGTKSK
jgi:hypothetical protein